MNELPGGESWCANDYVQRSDLQQAMAEQVLALVSLRGDEHVLDIGCGDGRISARIATELVPHGTVCGMDASADMIAFAQRRHVDTPNVHYLVADVRHMHFDSSFDAAVSFNALHWVPDVLPALRALRGALIEEGRAWLRFVTQGEVASVEAIAEQVRRESAWSPWFADFQDPYLRLSGERVATLALNARLGVLHLRTRLEEWDFGSRGALVDFCLAGFGAWTRGLPPERRKAFVEAVVDRYVSSRLEGEAGIFRFYQTDMTLMAV